MRPDRFLPLILLAALPSCEAAEIPPPTEYEQFLTIHSANRRALQDPFFSPAAGADLPDDVPIPKGFVRLPSREGDFPDARVVFIRYGGLSTIADVAAFYRGVLPAFGWREIGRGEEARRTGLLFRKAGMEVRLELRVGDPPRFIVLGIRIQRAGGNPS